ncbi:hypothetical protein B0H12DRAFT_1070200 [Mycena haematopus]|nr:hypothetical protein B0H12DRAFT_1070200 [Mycena haematopus]
MSMSRLAIPGLVLQPTTSTPTRETNRGLVHAAIQRLEAHSSSIASSSWDDAAAPPHLSAVESSDSTIARWVANTQLNLFVREQLGGTWPTRNANLEAGEVPIAKGSAPEAIEKENIGSSSASTELVMEVLSPQARDALTALSQNDGDVAVGSDVVLGPMPQSRDAWDFNASTVPPATIRTNAWHTAEEAWGSLEAPERSRSVQSVTDDADSTWMGGFLRPLAQELYALDDLVDDGSDDFSDILNVGEGRCFHDPPSHEDHWRDESVEGGMTAAALNLNTNPAEFTRDDEDEVIPAPTRGVELGQASFVAGAARTMPASTVLGQFHFRPECTRSIQRRAPPAVCPWGYIGEGRPSKSQVPAFPSSPTASSSLATPPLSLADVDDSSQASSMDSSPPLVTTLPILLGFQGENERDDAESVAANEDSDESSDSSDWDDGSSGGYSGDEESEDGVCEEDSWFRLSW